MGKTHSVPMRAALRNNASVKPVYCIGDVVHLSANVAK